MKKILKKTQTPAISVSAQPPRSLLTHCIVVLFHFLLLCVPLFFQFRTDELFEFNKMLLTYSVGTLITGLGLTFILIYHNWRPRLTTLDIPLLLFLISLLISTILSIHPRTSLFGYYSRFHGGVLSTLQFILLYWVTTQIIKRQHIGQFLLTCALATLLVSSYAILEHFGYSFSCLLYTQGSQFDTSCWIQDVQHRVFASFGQPNWLAAYLVTLLPILSLLAIDVSTARLRRAVFMTSSVLGLTALLYTQSKSGLLGLLISYIVLSGCLLASQTIRAHVSKKWLTLLASLLIIVCFMTGTFQTQLLSALNTIETIAPGLLPVTQNPPTASAEPLLSDQLHLPALDVGGTDSGKIRTIVWNGAIAIWRRYPIFGSGVETFAYSYYLDRPAAHNLVSEWDFLYNKAHNEFLNYLATTGIVGLTTYLSVLGTFAFWTWQQLKKKPTLQNQTTKQNNNQLKLLGFGLGVLGLSVSNFFGFSTVAVNTLMFLFFAWSWLLVQPEVWPVTTQIDQKKSSILSTGRIISIVAVWLIVIVIELGIRRIWQADIAFAAGKNLIQSADLVEGLTKLETAVQLSPQEALFYDELAYNYADVAVTLAENKAESTDAATAAVAYSNYALELNPNNLNFYKTRARIFILLAQLEPSFLELAADAYTQASQRAPTDPKLLYHLALVEKNLQATASARTHLQTARDLKPNYEDVRWQLAELYEAAGELSNAQTEYQALVQLNPTNQLALEQLNRLNDTIAREATQSQKLNHKQK